MTEDEMKSRSCDLIIAITEVREQNREYEETIKANEHDINEALIELAQIGEALLIERIVRLCNTPNLFAPVL